MRIKEITDEHVLFTDGTEITFWHYQECCENNYADFEQLDDLARDYDFHQPLLFESVDGAGFRFGDERRMFFVPCYSVQNGYYTSAIYIEYKGEPVLSFGCEFVYVL